MFVVSTVNLGFPKPSVDIVSFVRCGKVKGEFHCFVVQPNFVDTFHDAAPVSGRSSELPRNDVPLPVIFASDAGTRTHLGVLEHPVYLLRNSGIRREEPPGSIKFHRSRRQQTGYLNPGVRNFLQGNSFGGRSRNDQERRRRGRRGTINLFRPVFHGSDHVARSRSKNTWRLAMGPGFMHASGHRSDQCLCAIIVRPVLSGFRECINYEKYSH